MIAVVLQKFFCTACIPNVCEIYKYKLETSHKTHTYLSQTHLSSDEMSLLSRGLNFVPADISVCLTEFLTQINLCRASHLRSIILVLCDNDAVVSDQHFVNDQVPNVQMDFQDWCRVCDFEDLAFRLIS